MHLKKMQCNYKRISPKKGIMNRIVIICDNTKHIQTLHEPTGKMISAGYESKEHINNLIVNYKAMIEAAQGEEE